MVAKIEKLQMKTNIRKYGTLMVAILVFIMFACLAPRFLTLQNMMLLLKQMSAITIFSLGFTFVLAAGGFDMSVGYTTGLVGILFAMALLETNNFIFSLLVAILVGLAVGAANGGLISYVGLPDFIGTFAMGSIVYGVKMMLTEGNSIFIKGIEGPSIDFFKFLNSGLVLDFIPIMAIIMFFFVAIAYVILEKTKFGRCIYAVGGNKEAAMFAGINVKLYKFLAYVIASLCVAFCSILVCSRINCAQPTSGERYLTDAISIVNLSKTMFGDGQPTVWGTVVGAFIISMLTNGMTMLGMTYYFQDITKGVVVIVAVLMSVTMDKQK